MAGTILAFSYVILRGLDRLGYDRIPAADREAYLHRWNVVGHLMGVRGDLMATTMEQAEELFDAIRDPHMARSAQGVALAAALVAFMESHVPAWLPLAKPLPRLLMVELCDARTMDLLDIRLTPAERATTTRMLRVMRWWGRTEQHALEELAPLRAGTRWMFRHTARHLIRTPRGGQRGAFTIPPALAARWGVSTSG
jgi:hypothetical protein